MRQGALVALVATAPERVAPMLAQLAFDATLAYGARLEVLDLLMAGAQDLSGVKPQVATPAARSAGQSLLGEAGPRRAIGAASNGGGHTGGRGAAGWGSGRGASGGCGVCRDQFTGTAGSGFRRRDSRRASYGSTRAARGNGRGPAECQPADADIGTGRFVRTCWARP